MSVQSDKLRFLVTDAAEAIVIHEALMSLRNRGGDWPADVLRAEAADRLLARLDWAIGHLHAQRRAEAEASVVVSEERVRTP